MIKITSYHHITLPIIALSCVAFIYPFAPLSAAEDMASEPIETATPSLSDDPALPSLREILCGPAPAWPELKPMEGDQTELQSDQADMSDKNITTFTGKVVIQKTDTQLEADKARYFHGTDDIEAEGNVRLYTQDVLLKGTEATFNMNKEVGKISNATYQTKGDSSGTADSINIIDPSRIELENASYTTCVGEDPDWIMRASTLRLNNETRQGHATHSVLRFMGVPFFYFPYLRFPIGDARLSGFLFPNIGNSDKSGVEVILPYYWNIAPNRDATITPWYMDKRGSAMIMTEFRYLNPENSGQLEFDYMDKDDVYGDNRERIHWKHQSTTTEGWASSVNYNRVHDNDHYVDFGRQLNNKRPTNLERRGSLSYNATNWSVQGQVQSYQALSGSAPYERLPQFTFTSQLPQHDNELYPGIKAETVHFYRNDSSVQGDRLHLLPYLSLPLSNEAMYLTPKLSWFYTQYKLTNTSSSQSEYMSVDAPIFSLDSGIFLERNFNIGDSAYLQTLEPQLVYVHTPYRDQNRLPVFDSGISSFGINDTTRENRFSGADRIEDADRLTALITTRFINDEDGSEKLLARIGQQFYFDDRDVVLPGASIETQHQSAIIAEVISRPTANWYVASDGRWDPELKDYTDGNLRIEYADTKLEIKMNYRYQKDTLETNEGLLSWQLTPRWKIKTRKLYDIRYHRDQETEYSLRYDSCCWGLSLTTKDTFINTSEPYDKSIYLELELKGLSSIGAGISPSR
ncbi:MAG: LPS-assembly protein LptD [Gammaproteobacteria bacterium]|nr:LPS-assembly protein LptD [Gammaproteobacteria bacterium]